MISEQKYAVSSINSTCRDGNRNVLRRAFPRVALAFPTCGNSKRLITRPFSQHKEIKNLSGYFLKRKLGNHPKWAVPESFPIIKNVWLFGLERVADGCVVALAAAVAVLYVA